MAENSKVAANERKVDRRILIINPNTNPAVTDGIRVAAKSVINSTTDIAVINPREGPFSIETPSDRAEAVPRVIDLVRECSAGRYDAYVLGCFDDIALYEARELVDVPIVGTCEAGIAAARTVARRFAIVTTVHSAVPNICDVMEHYGITDMCTVRAAGVGVAAAAGNGADAVEKLLRTMRAAVDEDGAEAILLGSGGLAGKAASFRSEVSVPIIDGLQAAVKMAEGFAKQFK